MKQFNFTQAERIADKKQIILIIGKDAYRRMVLRKWEIRKIENNITK
jgi:hypothetical protein